MHFFENLKNALGLLPLICFIRCGPTPPPWHDCSDGFIGLPTSAVAWGRGQCGGLLFVLCMALCIIYSKYRVLVCNIKILQDQTEPQQEHQVLPYSCMSYIQRTNTPTIPGGATLPVRLTLLYMAQPTHTLARNVEVPYFDREDTELLSSNCKHEIYRI